MTTRFKHIALAMAAVVLYSCNNSPSKNHGPIVLGDSSTIVTETDPEKLRDLVTDLKPVIKTADVKDSIEAAEKLAAQQRADDSAKKATVNTAAAASAANSTANKTTTSPPATKLSGSGLNADFGGVSFLIPNINAKLASNPNLQKASGATYSLVSGTIAGNQLQVTANVTKVSQRYQTVIAVKNELGTLPLETLSTTSSWEALKGSGNVYRITGLEPKSLDYSEANRNQIRAAVAKSAKRHRMSRRKAQDWEESVRNVKASNQKPCYVILRSVMWKIDGKDANGKVFSKQIRVDMPL